MLSVMWDNGPQTFWGHNLDLYRSRDVIGHVTIGLPIGHLLLVMHWHRGSISKRLRDSPIRPQSPCAHTHNTHRNTHTRRKWFYILFHAMYCIGQTIMSSPSANRVQWVCAYEVLPSWNRRTTCVCRCLSYRWSRSRAVLMAHFYHKLYPDNTYAG